MNKIISFLAFMSLVLFPLSFLMAAPEEMNKANNPLTPIAAVNFQDYLIFSQFGNDESANSFLLDSIFPKKIGDVPQLFQLSVPYSRIPTESSEKVNGFGDVSIYDVWLVRPMNGIEFGIGPYFVFPTASEDEIGTGKWQAGVTASAVKVADEGVLGATLTYQHSYAGPSDRSTQNLLTFRPFASFNLPESYYLRSSGIVKINWANGEYYIPIGAGLGRVWKLENGNILNLFVEPQVSIIHGGDDLPKFQTYVGLNLQIPVDL